MPANRIRKPLIVDCQVFQTGAWHRGMGKYSKAFLGALLKNKGAMNYYKVYLLFNNNLEGNPEAIEYFSRMSEEFEVIYVNLALPREPRNRYSVAPIIQRNKEILNEAIRERFKKKEFDFLIPALYLDDVCSVFPDLASEKIIIYYDSIPYLYYQRYSQFNGFFENFYMPHTVTVFEATKVLTISETVANDLHVFFGISSKKICNIDGASIPRNSSDICKPAGFGLKKNEFVLMPTGQELRKNNLRAVQAFEKFYKKDGSGRKLIITSNFSNEGQAELRGISNNIIFTGNVSEGEMLWLYKNCRFVVFPSEYEGLGLPILEAVEQSKVIACSDISVFREISSSAFVLFDPLDVESISNALSSATEHPHISESVKIEYDAIISKYSWQNSVRYFMGNIKWKPTIRNNCKKLRVAIFCPDPSGFSAIGKVVTESHAWYAEYFDITYYFSKGRNHRDIRPNLLSYLAPSYDAKDFSEEDVTKFDAIIYHIGNSEYHLDIIHTSLVFPGYVVLHDTHLNYAYQDLIRDGYITDERLAWEDKLDQALPDNDEFGGPRSSSLTSIINNQLGVITHSEYAKKAVLKKLINKAILVQQVNLPVAVPIFPDIVHRSAGKFNLALAGIIAQIKGTDIITKIAQSDEFSNCNINIFGFSAGVPEKLNNLRSLPNVTLITNPSDFKFQSLLASTDVLINVRLAYMGETSLTTLEAMRYGAVVLVRDFGWYSELPDDAVVRVAEPSETISALSEVLNDPDKLVSIRLNARNLARRKFSHRAYAKSMYELILHNVSR